jgi:hypothetical protein
VEHSSVSLIPYLPNGKQGEGCQRLALGVSAGSKKVPPFVDTKARPLPWINSMDTKPFL